MMRACIKVKTRLASLIYGKWRRRRRIKLNSILDPKNKKVKIEFWDPVEFNPVLY